MALDCPLNTLLTSLKFKSKEDAATVQKITKSSKEIVKDALATVPTISVEEALALVDSDAHVFVDLRDGMEQAKSGIIPDAIASSRGLLEFHIDPESSAHKPAFSQDKTYIFYCASGGRSALAAKVAMAMGLKPVVNMTGGVAAWKKESGPLGQFIRRPKTQ